MMLITNFIYFMDSSDACIHLNFMVETNSSEAENRNFFFHEKRTEYVNPNIESKSGRNIFIDNVSLFKSYDFV